MCGIFGAISSEDVKKDLIEGLSKLEYRGYDSAGLSLITSASKIKRIRCTGKVKELKKLLLKSKSKGKCGIAHTRWATHGIPNLKNSHPHNSGPFSIVHNGIIENSEELKSSLLKKGYKFTSDTDSEVIAHLLTSCIKKNKDLLGTILSALDKLKGSFALAIIYDKYPDNIIVASNGSPLLIGISKNATYVASDIHALVSKTKKYIPLEDNELAIVSRGNVILYNKKGRKISRPPLVTKQIDKTTSKRGFKHYMQKEIFEQKDIISRVIKDRLGTKTILPNIFGPKSDVMLKSIKHVHFVACGTSYNASLIAKYWIEELSDIMCTAEIASEYRYRTINIPSDTLFVAISQSGETADTIYSLKKAKTSNYKAILSICNVPESTITRLSDYSYLMQAGVEISVASTKAFTSQLIALLLLSTILSRSSGKYSIEAEIVKQINSLPKILDKTFKLENDMKTMAKQFKNKHHTLFLGRGASYPIALEAALKLKEISYIHAEGYAAGELKHGPLALVDKDMPVVGLMPDNNLVNQVLSNLSEVKARHGLVYIFTNKKMKLKRNDKTKIIKMPACGHYIAPLVYVIPMQLLSYHVAIFKKTNIDQPRNLAKSVTVE
ncbi:MAG: glutamine--fructose-6-phosphate transaminase (isomerizing) [Gammaproteobacteria bacterium]|nr:glutamine--fructose-6-phosphate transaminase (isomerizing) [Gammaproteobacteria bacterium]MBT4462336.1 glutamine--fructose-6-phosphate transaminase (isomerizing) [Gammaproteobacteria bacterium]MBT4655263.1 glutamine--fructose-6-phosphate transaminase (isomerizing) [Gammaproteobacteria bacterium]MBT5117046.1 glutamine--fructose-6-phosphate transaminase (isomerizing) [Gammaproteobacteria bacterium]MBT5762078.1 glutamine--fructose-6-phosphate transaminase (isomerizing) [Gammaproteobacteria bact